MGPGVRYSALSTAQGTALAGWARESIGFIFPVLSFTLFSEEVSQSTHNLPDSQTSVYENSLSCIFNNSQSTTAHHSI